MRKSILRIFSVMVISVLLLGMFPFAAFAEGTVAERVADLKNDALDLASSGYVTDASLSSFHDAVSAVTGEDESAETALKAAADLLELKDDVVVPMSDLLGDNYYLVAVADQVTKTTVASGAEFKAMADLMNAGTMPYSIVVTQTADIDLSSYPNLRVGTSISTQFAGTYDGNNKSIINYKTTDGASNSGLFYALKGTIKNLTLKNASVVLGTQSGMLVGKTVNGAKLENVHISGGTMTFSIGSSGRIGCMIGEDINTNAKFTVTGCSVTGVTITGTTTHTGDVYHLGYIIGRQRATASGTLIENTYTYGNSVSVSGTKNISLIGGLAGGGANLTIKNCGSFNNTATGKVTNVAGFVGGGATSCKISNCYTDSAHINVTGSSTPTNCYTEQTAAAIADGSLAYTLKTSTTTAENWVQTTYPKVDPDGKTVCKAIYMVEDALYHTAYTDVDGKVILPAVDPVVEGKLFQGWSDPVVEDDVATYTAKLIEDTVVLNVQALIAAIGEVNTESGAKITAARNAYNALTDEEKGRVKNLSVLEAAEAAYQVILDDQAAAKAVDDLIAAIGEVTIDSKSEIDAARAAYTALTDTQKGYVTLLAVLESAEDTYQSNLSDQQRAQEVDEIIDSIGTVSAESGAVIQAAREAYDALNDNQKGYVTKLSALEAAEAAYAEILADQAAAKAVDDRIAAIGEVTEESEADIEAARGAYNALTDAQKAYVTKLNALEAAEAAYAKILADQAAAKGVDDLIDAIGEVTDASAEKINAARGAYAALTDAQKAYVTKLSALEEAEAVYNAILEQKNGVKKVYFAAPAIFANAGVEVDLSEYSVMFDAYHMTDAAKIEWSSEALSIANNKIDPEKGVYQLTAKSGEAEKTVYLVVKEPAEKEYVLYEKDFADVESFAQLQEEGYFVAQIKDGQSASVADGKLILDGDALNEQMRVLLPWWLADFGDYTFEANVSFNNAYNNTRWFALGYRTQEGNADYPYLPYQVFTTRANSHTNNSGVEFSRTTATGAWNKEFPAKNTFSIYQNGDHLYKVSAYGTHQTGSIDGSILHDNEYPADYATGGIGFVSGGAEIAVSDLKVTLDRKAIERLYAKVITDAEPSLFAKVGEEIDLSQYSVMYNSGSTVCAEHLSWASADLTITNGKVTATKAGFYQLTAAAKNPPLNASGNPAPINRTIYLMVDAKMNKVDTPASNVIMPASVITYIDSAAELNGILNYETTPATAILRLNKKLEVVSPTGEKIASLEDALLALGNRVMPAFYVTHKTTVDSLVAYANENALTDSFVVAQNGALIERAREGYYFFRGVLDLSGKQIENAYEARKLTNEANARICILPSNMANKANVEYLQRLLMTPWVISNDTATDMVGSITSGANGIITEAPAVLMQAFSLYFEQNTLTCAPALIGHRGSPILGQPNTVDGSMKAYEAGATAIENDVYITTDGVVVVMHDSTIDATTNGSGKVENMTYAQLQQYHVDANANADPQPIPTLEEYFEAFKGLDVQLIVEIKSYKTEICQAIVDLIKEYDIADQVNVISFTGTQLQEMKKLMPELSVGVLTGSVVVSENAPEESLYRILRYTQLYDSTFNPNFTKGPMDKKVMTAAHQRGVGIHLWSLNYATDLNSYFMKGADSITTDYAHYYADTVKSFSADQKVYRMGSEGITINLSAKTYDRSEAALTGATMKVIEGDDVFTYENGKITASADGEATVIFSLPCNLPDGTTYYVTTEPIKLIAENTAAGKINADEVVDTADAVCLMRYLLGETDAVAVENCDVNGDGEISLADVVRLLRRCAQN